jgi:hypothetical protein
MATFTQELTEIAPNIASHEAAAFRSSLIALGRQLQDEPDSQAHSLQTWWQWLDDEGYDRETFATILAQICKAKIGEQSLLELTSFITSSKDNSDGIAMLLEQVKQSHPSFAEEVEILESLALEEDNQLAATAGGMSKGGKIGIVVGAVGLTGLIGGGIYLAIARKRRTGAMNQAIEHGMIREGEAAHHGATNEIEEAYNHVDQDPDKIINNLKTNENRVREKWAVSQFDAKDLDDKAEIYAKAHAKHFKDDIERRIEGKVEEEYLDNEEEYIDDLMKYDKVNGGFLTKAEEEGRDIRKFDNYRVREIKREYEISPGFQENLSKWTKNTPSGQKAERDARGMYERSTKSAYRDLLAIEKEYKIMGEEFHAWSKIQSKADGFANTEVDKVINEIDVFGTDITFDIEKRAKEAKKDFIKAIDSLAEKEELEAAQLARDAETKAEREAEAAKREAEDKLINIEDLAADLGRKSERV